MWSVFGRNPFRWSFAWSSIRAFWKGLMKKKRRAGYKMGPYPPIVSHLSCRFFWALWDCCFAIRGSIFFYLLWGRFFFEKMLSRMAIFWKKLRVVFWKRYGVFFWKTCGVFWYQHRAFWKKSTWCKTTRCFQFLAVNSTVSMSDAFTTMNMAWEI